MARLIAVIIGLIVALVLGGIRALQDSNLNFWGEIAKILLTVAGTLITAVLITGGLTLLINERESKRVARETKREYWREVLRDLVSVNDAVQASRLLIDAHQTLRTYGEQMRKLFTWTDSLRRLEIELEVMEDKKWLDLDLKDVNGLVNSIENMRRYLENLGSVYKKHYLEAAKMEPVTGPPLAPFEPSPAWEFIKEHPNLKDFLDDDKFENSIFRKGYWNARQRIRERLGQLVKIDQRTISQVRTIE